MSSRLAIAAALLAPLLAAAAPRLERVEVKTLPGKGNDVVISVTIERPTPLDLQCDAVIDTGDGRQIEMSWGIGEARTKTARHEYRASGSYRIRASGTGRDACVGMKEATVRVGSAEKTATATRRPVCPAGWALVEDSVKGARYACRPKPPAQPLACGEGTKYYAERGEIGCR
jgi:hypothetical protein